MRLFVDLPLGTRFKYTLAGKTWVVIQRYGCGIVASWDGGSGSAAVQEIHQAESSPTLCRKLMVHVVD